MTCIGKFNPFRKTNDPVTTPIEREKFEYPPPLQKAIEGMQRDMDSKRFRDLILNTSIDHKRQPIEHFSEENRPFVRTKIIYLVTDPERPGFILSFGDEEACNHYCVTNQCVYTQIPLYTIR